MKHTAADTRAELSTADRVWISVALLHHEHPERQDFAEHEIISRADVEGLLSVVSTFRTNISRHCVANKAPKPNKHRMLFATASGRRRLFKEGDPAHPERQGKVTPNPEDIPSKYHYLLEWYRTEYSPPPRDEWLRGIFEMEGAGKDIWAGVDPDEYVRQLREGWD